MHLCPIKKVCYCACNSCLYIYIINQINKMSNNNKTMNKKRILVLQVKLALLIIFSLVASCLLGFFTKDVIILVTGLLVLFLLSWFAVKILIVNQFMNAIQELKQSEEEARILSEDFKSLSVTQQKFLDLMSHDLKTPFNGIEGFTNLLLDTSEHYTEEERRVFLQHILQSTSSANKLISRLSKWARLQTGRWKANACTFEINKLIHGVVSFHSANALQKRVHLIADLKETVLVLADQLMIETALRNLVSNAIKFTQPDGFVKITIKKQDKDLVVLIEDNGKGMSPKLVGDLFIIGERVVLPDISGKMGTGLGLILCKEFIEKNGGNIWVISEPGKGSKFYFTLPLAS